MSTEQVSKNLAIVSTIARIVFYLAIISTIIGYFFVSWWWGMAPVVAISGIVLYGAKGALEN